MQSATDRQQAAALDKLGKLKVGALFMDPGCGKTKVALEMMAAKAGRCGPLVWICPASLKNTIKAEIEKWTPGLQVQLFSCEGIGASTRIYGRARETIWDKDAFVVVDESLKIKNREAACTKRIIQLGATAKYKLILNGTPMSKNILDLWSQMEFLSPLILKRTYRQFKEDFTIFDIDGPHAGDVRATVNVPYLMSLIEPYVFEAHLELSTSKKHAYCRYQLDDPCEYSEFKKRLATEMNPFDSAISRTSFYTFVMRIQQFYLQHSNRREKMNALLAQINEPTIVFCRFRASIPEGAVSITGSTPKRQRKEIFKRFEAGEFRVLYLMLGCGGFGLNLQFCHNIIFAEQFWDYATLIQAEGRIYRTGQVEDANYYTMLCEGVGLEDKIQANIERKGTLLAEAREGIQRARKAGNADEAIAKLIKEL